MPCHAAYCDNKARNCTSDIKNSYLCVFYSYIKAIKSTILTKFFKIFIYL